MAEWHQTWQSGDLLLGASTHKVTWSFKQVALRGHVTNQIISPIAESLVSTRLGKVLILKIAGSYPQSPMTLWSRDQGVVTKQLEKLQLLAT